MARGGAAGLVIPRLGLGGLLAEMSCLTNDGASATIVADEEAEVSMIERDALYALLEERPQIVGRFYQSLAALLAERLVDTQSRLVSAHRALVMSGAPSDDK